LVEVHLLDFHGSLRGKRLNVCLTKRLREERQFSDVEKLRQQIKLDIKKVKALSDLTRCVIMTKSWY
jgi:riboflavin kinase/FMN adenylyltransferase